MYLLSKTWRPPGSIPVIIKTIYKFTLPHRHDAGAVCIRPVAAPHHRTDPWRLPVRELWRLLHRNGAVCGERGCVFVPATATPQQETRKQRVKLIHQGLFLSTKKYRSGNRGFWDRGWRFSPPRCLYLKLLFTETLALLLNILRIQPLDGSTSSVLLEDTLSRLTWSLASFALVWWLF